MELTLKEVKANPKIQDFIEKTEQLLDAIGYTDHGKRHVNLVSDRARSLAQKLGLKKQDQELVSIAGYCHDMGNFLGRTQHHYWGAFLFSQVFMSLMEDSSGITTVMQAIASHDKDDLKLVNKISAILILADKSDVHRDRVRTKDLKTIKSDIHDRVNYSVVKNDFSFKGKEIILRLKVDTRITDPLEYFEIFTDRMAFCRQAAKYLGCKFKLIINDFKLSA
ncbi:MAG: HD domain-containing protein [Patescibacteria group bacterium]